MSAAIGATRRAHCADRLNPPHQTAAESPAKVSYGASSCDVTTHRGQTNPPLNVVQRWFPHPLVALGGDDRGLPEQSTVFGDDPDISPVDIDADPGARLFSVDIEVQHLVAMAQADSM